MQSDVRKKVYQKFMKNKREANEGRSEAGMNGHGRGWDRGNSCSSGTEAGGEGTGRYVGPARRPPEPLLGVAAATSVSAMRPGGLFGRPGNFQVRPADGPNGPARQ